VLDDFLFRVRSLFRKKAVEAELDDELRFHMNGQLDKLLKSGLPREEALRRVRMAFGGLDQVKRGRISATLYDGSAKLPPSQPLLSSR